MNWLLAVVAALAAYRATRLVTTDRVFDRAREAVIRRWPSVGYGVTCDWCVSVWVGGGVAVAAVWWGENRLVVVGLAALAFSAVTGWLANLEP